MFDKPCYYSTGKFCIVDTKRYVNVFRQRKLCNNRKCKTTEPSKLKYWTIYGEYSLFCKWLDYHTTG